MPDIVNYKIYVSRDNFVTFEPGFNGLTIEDVNTYHVGPLEPGVAYKAYVTKTINGFESTLSEIIEISTNSLTAPVVYVENATNEGFDVYLDSFTGIDGYNIYISRDNFATFEPGWNGTTQVSDTFTITGLDDAVEFKIKATTTVSGFESAFSNVETITTLPAGSPPGPTEVLLDLNYLTNTSMTILLQPIFEAEDYETEISSDNFVTVDTYYATISGNPFTVTGLLENTEYKVRSKTSNSFGESAWSDVVTFRTKTEIILYASNKVTRRYMYQSDFAKSFDERIGVQVTHDEGELNNASIRPDGAYYAYDADPTNTNKRQIFIKNLSTGVITNITNDDANDYGNPVFKPDDPVFEPDELENVYCIRFNANGFNDLVRINIGTLAKSNLRSAINGFRNMSFSSNGSLLIFDYFSSLRYIATLTTSNYSAAFTNLISRSSLNQLNCRGFSPDMTKILYTEASGGGFQIFDMNANGTSPTQRTTGGNSLFPIYSPDGTKLLFQKTAGSDTYIMSCDNTYDEITGYFQNQNTWVNNAGNLSELPLAWRLVQFSGVPGGLAVTSLTNTTAEISFNSVLGATSYKLYIYDGGIPISGYDGKVITLTTESVIGLDENKIYTVKVSSCSWIGCSALSSEVTFKTKKEVIFYASNKDTRRYIYMTDLAKSFDERIGTQTSYAEGTSISNVAISTNGVYVAYLTDFYASNRSQISVKNMQTGVITNYALDNNYDNRTIAFKNGDNNNLYIADLRISPQSQLISSINLTTGVKTFIEDNGYNFGIYGMNFNSDNSVLVYTTASTSWITAKRSGSTLTRASETVLINHGTWSYGATSPQVDKVRNKIAYQSIASGFTQIFDMNFDGTSKTQRTTGSLNKGGFVYSPDGSKILFGETSGSDNYINIADTSYDSGTGHFENIIPFINTAGNLTESVLGWGLVQF